MITVSDLTKHYALPKRFTDIFSKKKGSAEARVLRAVDGVDFTIREGEVLGLVGESGCGKSTMARLMVGLETPTHGDVMFAGVNARTLKAQDRKAFHRKVQMVFQDPYGSLNPQHKIKELIARPLIYQKLPLSDIERTQAVIEAMTEAGLTPVEQFLEKYPHQLSGGQRQRVCIARAIVIKPELLVADEPISMLDVSIKWGIIQLLKRLVKQRRLALLYITHDLSSAGAICDQLAIMYLGKVVEYGPSKEILANPQHPYTKALLGSTPSIDIKNKRPPIEIRGGIPNATAVPTGCRFHPRCSIAQPACSQTEPVPDKAALHRVACHFVQESTLAQAEA